MITRYVQGLQHRLAGTEVAVILIKPGPTRTPMTAHLGDSGPSLADVAKVAATIVSGMEKRRSVVYARSHMVTSIHDDTTRICRASSSTEWILRH